MAGEKGQRETVRLTSKKPLGKERLGTPSHPGYIHKQSMGGGGVEKPAIYKLQKAAPETPASVLPRLCLFLARCHP